MRTDGYVVVQPWMVTDYNLKGNKLLVYALIWGFSQDEQSCFYGSTRYIMDYFKLSERAVVGILDELVEDGLLSKWSEPVNGRTTNRYAALRPAACSAVDDGCQNCNHEENAPMQKVQADPCKKCSSTPAKSAGKKENNNKSENKGTSATRFSPPKVEELKAYFQEKGLSSKDAQLEAEKFIDRYEANGWIVGKVKMKKWKSAANNWLRNRKEWGQTAAQSAASYSGRTWEDL